MQEGYRDPDTVVFVHREAETTTKHPATLDLACNYLAQWVIISELVGSMTMVIVEVAMPSKVYCCECICGQTPTFSTQASTHSHAIRGQFYAGHVRRSENTRYLGTYSLKTT